MVPAAAVLAYAQATYRSRFRGAYAHIVHDPCHRADHPPPKSSASRTDPPTDRGLKRAELPVVPVIPTPPMAAEESETRELGNA